MSQVRPPHTSRPYTIPRVLGPTIRKLVSGDLSLEKFWQQVSGEGTPLVEPADDPRERIVTFLWRERGETRNVVLLANKLTDHTNLREALFERIPGTDVWHAGFRLGSDWRASYHLAVDDTLTPVAVDPDADEYWRALLGMARPDPLAKARMPARWGGPDKSVAELPEAPPQYWRRRRNNVRQGKITEHEYSSVHLDCTRTLWTYTPPGHQQGRRYPLLVLLDGDAWVSQLDIATTLDNLIADEQIPPLVAVLPDSVDVSTRSAELACQASYVAFLTEELTPWAEHKLGATQDPVETIIAGQSLSGLTASFAGLRAPERFGNVLSQSGSFWFAGIYGNEPHWLTTQFAQVETQPLRFYLEVGLQEWIVLEDTRQLRDVLRAKGYALNYVEFNGGHDYACWRGGLAEGLIALTSTQVKPVRG